MLAGHGFTHTQEGDASPSGSVPIVGTVAYIEVGTRATVQGQADEPHPVQVGQASQAGHSDIDPQHPGLEFQNLGRVS